MSCSGSEGDSGLEDCDFAVALGFVVYIFAGGGTQDKGTECFEGMLDGGVFSDDSGVEVYPCGFAFRKGGVGGDFHRGDEGAEGGAAACGEQYDLAAGGGEGGRGYEVVAGRAEQVETAFG